MSYNAILAPVSFRTAADFFEWEVALEAAAVWTAITGNDTRETTDWITVYWVIYRTVAGQQCFEMGLHLARYK